MIVASEFLDCTAPDPPAQRLLVVGLVDNPTAGQTHMVAINSIGIRVKVSMPAFQAGVFEIEGFALNREQARDFAMLLMEAVAPALDTGEGLER